MANSKWDLKTDNRIKVIIAIITVTLIVIMFPKGESLDSEVTVGSIWIKEDLIASTAFEVLKDKKQYQQEKKEAAEKINPIFVYNTELSKTILDSLNNYNNYLLNVLDADLENDTVSYNNKTILQPSSYNKLLNIRRFENSLSNERFVNISDVFRNTRNVLTTLYKKGIVNVPYSKFEKDTISVREGKFERNTSIKKYNDLSSANDYIFNVFSQNLNAEKDIIEIAVEYAKHFIVPDIVYSAELTEEAKSIARDKVSRNTGIVNENERIIAKHNKITPEIKLMLDSYRAALAEEIGIWGEVTQYLGKVLHVVTILLLFTIYVFLFRKKIFEDNYKIILISIVILFNSGLTFLVHQINVSTPVQYLTMIPAGAMLLTVIFDSRIGFYGTVVISLIAGGLLGNDYAFATTNILGGAFAAYTVRDIKNRNQIFRSFLFITFGYIFSIFAFGLERFAPIQEMLTESAFGAVNALISPVLAYGLIIFFERAFKITTDLTLLELTDFNHPLLKELARKAPGTFTHSMTIGSLVESASEVIGANPLLARVGAYYHDIGKTLQPDTFVENQMENRNLHEKLGPRESAKIIIDHVKEGIKLAESHGLPKEIVDFIPMHHGTMPVYYFYKKAKEEAGDGIVDINDFRYPGPKANNKETALVMLADSCESAVRAMTEPTPERIRNIIDNLVQIRIDDNQLDDAPITFKDIRKVKEAFYDILMSQHHKRIRYPKQDELESKKD